MAARAAWVNGFLGTGLSLGVGVGAYELSIPEVLGAVFVANIAGLVALVLTLRVEHRFWAHLARRTGRTWGLLGLIYFTILLAGIPWLRTGEFWGMFLPLLISNGFMMIAFGPIQDRWVHRQQARALLQTKSKE